MSRSLLERASDLAAATDGPVSETLRDLAEALLLSRRALREFQTAGYNFVDWHPRYHGAIEMARAALAAAAPSTRADNQTQTKE